MRCMKLEQEQELQEQQALLHQVQQLHLAQDLVQQQRLGGSGALDMPSILDLDASTRDC
jgi:hypothetical protein